MRKANCAGSVRCSPPAACLAGSWRNTSKACTPSWCPPCPRSRAAYDSLLQVADVFRAERLSHLDEATSLHVAQGFDRRVGSAAAAALPEAGLLLVAAVAEERAGLDRVVDSLMDWLADPARFSAQWVAVATETLAAARNAVRG